MFGGRLTEPVSPSTYRRAPCQARRPARVTTNDGIPKAVTMNPLKSPIARPTPSPAKIPRSGGKPCWTLRTAITPAASPLTAPTERSISPSSRTSTTPIEIVAVAAICSVRLERLTAERKRSFAIWKIVQITAIPTSTRTEPRSPRPSARSARPTEKPSSSSAGPVPIVVSALTGSSPRSFALSRPPRSSRPRSPPEWPHRP